MQSPVFRREGRDIPIVKTIAVQKQGIEELVRLIGEDQQRPDTSGRRYRLLAERAWLLLQQQKMKGVNKRELAERIEAATKEGPFNLYRFVASLT
jgi:LAO/AO transport system kinase